MNSRAKLYNVACRYVQIVERLERTRDPEILANLEEERVIWHNRLMRVLKREGISFLHREHVTRLAYLIARSDE